MIPAQRRAQILEIIQREGAASIHDLAAALGTSVSTVRRDLDYLSDFRYVERTYGGAQAATRPSRTTFEPEYAIGRHTHEKEKRAIARCAVRMIEPESSVFFDSSSTVLEVALALAEAPAGVTAITNDLNIAVQLSQHPHVRTIVPGGTVRAHSYTLLGDPGVPFLDRIHVDLAFIGIHSLAGGILSDSSVEVVRVKRAVLDRSTRRVVLADASKFTAPRSFMSVGSLDEVDAVVTDDGIGSDDARAIAQAGTELHLARGRDA